MLQQDPGLDLRGEPLRGYRLLEKIDAGPTGLVFRALQPRVERDVAVKIFHEAIAADPEFVRRFERDALAVAALEHPHIVPIYDYWREPGRAYIVSRYLRGGSLRAIEESEPLDRERVLRPSSRSLWRSRSRTARGSRTETSVRPTSSSTRGERLSRGLPIGGVRRRTPGGRPGARSTRQALAAERPLLRRPCRAGPATADALAATARTALEPTAIAAPRRIEERNPYKGLRPFTEADARDFFGREDLVRRLVARLGKAGPGSRFVAVVGASGSGKSSVVRAGLVPAIRDGALGGREDPFVVEMFPGEHPIDELEAALLRIAVHPVPRLRERLDSGSRGLLEVVDLVAPGEAEVVIVVDQFEEAFTLTTDQRERERFLESLRGRRRPGESASRDRHLRADFYDRPLVYPRFGELLSEGPRRSLRSPPRSWSGRSEGRPRGSASGPSPGS